MSLQIKISQNSFIYLFIYVYMPKIKISMPWLNCTKQRRLSVSSQINARDASGQTPLHLACERGDVACVKELLEESQARTDIRDRNGETPIHCAAKQDTPAIIQVRRSRRGVTGYIYVCFLRCASPPPSSPRSGHVFADVLGRERAEQQRGDAAPRGLPYGARRGRQSSAGGRGQV